MPHHCDILEDLRVLNKAFLPILDYMVCYKAELGLCLQRLVEAYNIVTLDQFEGYYKNENHKEMELNRRAESLAKKEKAIDHSRHELYT